MRVLFISANYFPQLGGIELYIKGMAERLAKKGIDAHVVTGHVKDLERNEKLNGVFVHRINGKRIFFNRLTYFPELREKIKEVKPDVIHCCGNGHLIALQAVRLAKREKIPFFVLTWGALSTIKKRSFFANVAVNLYDSIITSHIFKNSSGVLSRLPNIKGWCLKKGAKKVFFTPTGIDEIFFTRVKKNEFRDLFNGKKIVGFVGTICKRKGIHTLIEAAPAIVEKDPSTIFLVATTNNIETEEKFFKKLIERIGELNLKEHIHFVKPIKENSSRLVQLFDSFDVFVLPSSFEGPSQAMLQAMAQAKPVIVANVPELRGFVDERNGFLIPYEDSKALEEKINLLLEDTAMRKKIGKHNRLEAKKYDLNNLSNRLEKILLSSLIS